MPAVVASSVSVNGTLTIQVNSVMRGTIQLVTETAPMTPNISQSFTTGASDSQVDIQYTETNILQASTPINVNLFGDTTRFDAIGQALNIARVKMVLLQNTNTLDSGGTITVGGLQSSSAFSPFLNSNSAGILLKPGGGICLYAFDATGYSGITSTSNYQLQLNPGTTTASYALYLLGCKE